MAALLALILSPELRGALSAAGAPSKFLPRAVPSASEWCVHEWRLRTDPGYLREQVFRRDKGICAICRVDAVEAHLQLRRARGERRQDRLAKWGIRGIRRSLWDADHILPVAEGGGECDLANIRTLCLICHRQVTHELRLRLRRKRLPD